jgi:hypothetical protein
MLLEISRASPSCRFPIKGILLKRLFQESKYSCMQSVQTRSASNKAGSFSSVQPCCMSQDTERWNIRDEPLTMNSTLVQSESPNVVACC